MSKNKNYGSFYNKKDPVEERSRPDEEIKEATTEERAETPAEEVPKAEEPKVEAPAPKKEEIFAVVVNSPKVNMRYKPDKGSQAINILPEKAKVKVLEETNEEWWKVHYKGYTGFMMTKYLKRV